MKRAGRSAEGKIKRLRYRSILFQKPGTKNARKKAAELPSATTASHSDTKKNRGEGVKKNQRQEGVEQHFLTI